MPIVPKGCSWPADGPKVVDVKSLAIDLDLVNVVDKLGTYENPLFPDSVKPAPRLRGPDGRLEGQVVVELK